MRKMIKIAFVIGISIALLMPISLVIADDTEPPVITSISYGPHAGVRTTPGFHLFQSCNVTDNVSVAVVRINITGPVGFLPINNTMVNVNGSRYYYEVNNVTISGTYQFYIWAKDTSNNTARSNTYHMLVFENYLSYIHVDVNNTAGPWNGTALHPLQYINDALAVIATNGTIFIHKGLYSNTSILLNKRLNLIGENQNTTILDGGGINSNFIVKTNGSFLIQLANMTLRNAKVGIYAQNDANTNLSHCTISRCSNSAVLLIQDQYFLVKNCKFQNNKRAINLTNCNNNKFYHNNFINNTIQVSSNSNSNNTWDNNITGNYWDDYRIKYPSASVVPSTGTWDTPYIVNASGNNIDNHPWVYPSGYIDTVPPQVTVIYPNGGEILTGVITIQWSASDDLTMDLNGTILLEYSADNGGSWIQIASQQNNTGSYVWDTTSVPDGNLYLIGVSTIDEFLNIGSDTSDSTFSINNFLPELPQLHGPSQGGNGILFDFVAVASDPQGEQIFYQWDWGDGNVSGWLGPFNSGVPTTTSYAWALDGNYSIRVKVKNIGGSESNWSAVHRMIVAEQVNFSNVKLGTVYFKLFSFNKSFIFSDFLSRLGIVIILTTHQIELEASVTDIVKSVTFKADNQFKVETMEIIDDNATDGFACNMNISRGIYILNITAYDGNGTLVDKYSLISVFFIRIGKYAMKPEQTSLQSLRIIRRLLH